MELEAAIEVLKKAVKYTGTIDQKHIDLTLIPTEKRDLYTKALVVSQKAVLEGKISRDDLLKKLTLE
ncbi:MAG: hypothetical protein AB7I27_16585 [Bacteriovoracaceae bacterium]